VGIVAAAEAGDDELEEGADDVLFGQGVEDRPIGGGGPVGGGVGGGWEKARWK
jgi:hypothetical protein